MSYCDTAAELFAIKECVSGFPAYTVPDWPAGLNTEPGALTALPGVTGLSVPQVLLGAPG